MTTLIFDWSDWDGPATGHVVVTRRTWRRAPESLHVPWQVVLPVDGRATLDVAHVAGEAVSILWAPQGAASRTDHVLVPDSGEHLAHLLERVDPSTLEPLPEDLPSAVDLVARAEALVARIESGEFRGEAGRGVASITAEGETATVRYTDGSASTLTLPAGPAGVPGRDGVDGAPGADGRDGQDGRTPDLTWQGTALAVDGVPGPDLRGPAGKDGTDGADGVNGAPGPAPSIKIGAVTSGATPSATITGTSPDLTLDLVFAKGDAGAAQDARIITGPGRPDVPGTTAGVITGSEPVGAEYRSTDGASVGADGWLKTSRGWIVAHGDTGVRIVPNPADNAYAAFSTWPDWKWTLRRMGTTVELFVFAKSKGPALPAKSRLSILMALPVGFRPSLTYLSGASGFAFQITSTKGEVALFGIPETDALIQAPLTFSTADPWPTAPLPGTPA